MSAPNVVFEGGSVIPAALVTLDEAESLVSPVLPVRQLKRSTRFNMCACKVGEDA